MWDDIGMVRPPIGAVSMHKTVKFRLSDQDEADLLSIADGASVSETLRGLIRAEKKRRKDKK